MPDSLPPPSWPSGRSSSPEHDAPPPPARGQEWPGPSPTTPPPPPPTSAESPLSTPPSAAWSTPGAPATGGARDVDDVGRPDGPGGGWAPDPSPRRSGRGWWIAAVVVGLVLLVGIAASVLVGDGGDTPEPVASVAPEAPADDATSAPGGDGDAGAEQDEGDVDPAVATAHRDLFSAIDESERTMIALGGITPDATDDLSEEELAAFQLEAGARADELEALRDQLEDGDDADSEAVATIRGRYLAHLGDWIDWANAVTDDPTLVDRPDAAGPYFEAINFSADDFATSVRDQLDRDAVPTDVRDLADEIIQRGFQGTGDDGTEI